MRAEKLPGKIRAAVQIFVPWPLDNDRQSGRTGRHGGTFFFFHVQVHVRIHFHFNFNFDFDFNFAVAAQQPQSLYGDNTAFFVKRQLVFFVYFDNNCVAVGKFALKHFQG